MNDIATCEQRLSLALARIDQGIDRLQGAMRDRPDGADIPADMVAVDEGQVDLHRRQQAALDHAQGQLVAANAQTARLAEANDSLIAANHALIAAMDTDALLQAVPAALRAEIDALHAARDAEIEQLRHILTVLESMIGPADAEQVAAAGFDADVETLPHEGRILRFGQDNPSPKDRPEDADHEDNDGERG